MRFVLIDEIVELRPAHSAVARKRFSADEEIFADHFPGSPIVPGTLLLEAIGQTAGWLLGATLGFSSWPLLAMVQSAKFRRFARPEETITLVAEIERAGKADFLVRGEAKLDGERIANAHLLFHTFSLGLEGAPGATFEAWCTSTFIRLGGPAALERYENGS